MRWLLVVGVAGLVGCSGADFEVVEGDGGSLDSATLDSGSGTDGTVDSTLDTGSLDTGSLDTGSLDTGSLDARPDAPVDSGTVDSAKDGALDTLADSATDSAVDSGADSTVDSGLDSSTDSAIDSSSDSSTDSAVDSGADSTVDSAFDGGGDSAGDAVADGPLCPRPPSTVTVDPALYTSCTELTTKYPLVLVEAKKCFCDADCSKQIERDFCGCMTNVSPANDAYVALKAMQTRWSKLSCFAICPQVLCSDPPAPKCVFDGSGGPGKCN